MVGGLCHKTFKYVCSYFVQLAMASAVGQDD